MTPVRVGCVGTGGIAKRHLDVLSQVNDVVIAAVASSDAARGATFANAYGATGYGSFHEMLEKERLDALLVTVIPSGHGEVEEAAIGAGLPMLIEKPLSNDRATAERVAKRLQAAGMEAAVGYQWRYNTTLTPVMEAIEGRAIALVNGTWVGKTPPPPWWSQRSQSGGQMVEQATHVVDLARYLAGEASRVYATAAQIIPGRTPEIVDDVEAALVNFASGAVGTFSTTHIASVFNQDVSLRIFCEGLAVTLTRERAVIEDGSSRREIEAVGDAVAHQDRAFIEAVKAGDLSTMRSTYTDALKTHRLTTTMAESAHGDAGALEVG